MWPAPRRHTAKKTDSTRDHIATVAGSNIYVLTKSIIAIIVGLYFIKSNYN